MALKLQGIEKVIKNLNKELDKIKGNSLKGMIRAQAVVRNSMDKEAPLIPVDEGNMRASYFTVTSNNAIISESAAVFKGKDGPAIAANHRTLVDKYKQAIQGDVPSIIFGFTANYTLIVHENIGATFKRPNAGAKFFEIAIQRNTKKMLELIAKEAKI